MQNQLVSTSESQYLFSIDDAKRVIEHIRRRIRQYFAENNITYAVVGASGGLDSSVIAGLLSGIETIKPVGVMMPCESDPDAERVARLVLEHFNIPSIRIDLSREFHFLMGALYSSEGIQGQLAEVLKCYRDSRLLKTIPHRKARASGNIKARLRMITLYHIAALTGGIVMSTDNLSEYWMGFWTINGDVGDFAPIQKVWKGLEEYTIAEALGVPKEAIEAVPTDGLDVIPGGTDEDQLGLPYPELDKVIISLLQNDFNGCVSSKTDDVASLCRSVADSLGHQADKVSAIAARMSGTHYKRIWPISLERTEIGLKDVKFLKV